jgi:hypothetical protein
MIYPSLPAPLDLGFVRVNGAGFGNCLFPYFHALVHAQREGRRVIAPCWRSIPLNHKLRGEAGFRRYDWMVGPHPDEIEGLAKAAALSSLRPFAQVQSVAPGQPLRASPRPLVVVRSSAFTFEGLAPHRAMLRQRLLQIMRRPPAGPPHWGESRFAAVHVRLGDFEPVDDDATDGIVPNVRLSLDWYAGLIARLRHFHPGLPVRIFSDGSDAELAPLLALPGVARARSVDDVNELIEMAEAAVLIGSHSTFSRWAAFLGNMSTIWRARQYRPERVTDPNKRAQHIGRDAAALEDPLA